MQSLANCQELAPLGEILLREIHTPILLIECDLDLDLENSDRAIKRT